MQGRLSSLAPGLMVTIVASPLGSANFLPCPPLNQLGDQVLDADFRDGIEVASHGHRPLRIEPNRRQAAEQSPFMGAELAVVGTFHPDHFPPGDVGWLLEVEINAQRRQILPFSSLWFRILAYMYSYSLSTPRIRSRFTIRAS